MIRLWEPELLPAQMRWMEGQLASGRKLVVEPWLERLADFSVQMEMDASGLRILGYTGLVNDLRGQFQSNWAEPRMERRPPAAVVRALGAGQVPEDLAGRVHGMFRSIAGRMEPELRRLGHEGPLGIDALVYRDASGVARLKPVVEINPRHTMGRLTLGLMRFVAPGRVGRFRLWTLKEVRAAGHPDFRTFAEWLRTERPWTREGEPVPRLASGAVCLNDPATARGWLAVWEVGRESQV